ncbi:MAG: lysozyme [Desulfobulbaceae bacterium]|nr:MAG: lysozyme [Desulfobulbaceae bacterium]
MDQQKLEQQLIEHEGLRLKPYVCPAGKITIGAGRNLDDNGISTAEAMVLLRNDILATTLRLEKVVPGFRSLSERRRMALIDMCYNLGLPRLLKFKKMLAAMLARDFDTAADEMLDSVWADQVGQRAHTLATMMREG